jgi:hypothetical protein
MADHQGHTPLTKAARQGDAAIVRLLLLHGGAGVDLDARNQRGRTPLWHACYWSRTEVARLLLEAGADPTAPDNEGLSAMHAINRGKRDCSTLLKVCSCVRCCCCFFRVCATASASAVAVSLVLLALLASPTPHTHLIPKPPGRLPPLQAYEQGYTLHRARALHESSIILSPGHTPEEGATAPAALLLGRQFVAPPPPYLSSRVKAHAPLPSVHVMRACAAGGLQALGGSGYVRRESVVGWVGQGGEGGGEEEEKKVAAVVVEHAVKGLNPQLFAELVSWVAATPVREGRPT